MTSRLSLKFRSFSLFWSQSNIRFLLCLIFKFLWVFKALLYWSIAIIKILFTKFTWIRLDINNFIGTLIIFLFPFFYIFDIRKFILLLFRNTKILFCSNGYMPVLVIGCWGLILSRFRLLWINLAFNLIDFCDSRFKSSKISINIKNQIPYHLY